MKKFILFAAVSLFLSFSIFAESIYVCVASFVNKDNAMNLVKQLENDDEDVCISEFVRADGQLFYRVLLRTNTQDLDQARSEAEASKLKGAFIVVPKAGDKIETVLPARKAPAAEAPVKNIAVPETKMPEPEIASSVTKAPATSPISIRSGATEIISSAADFEVFVKEVQEDIDDEEDDFENLGEFFQELSESEDIREELSAKELVSFIENLQKAVENLKEDLQDNNKATVSVDEKIKGDLSDLIPGFTLNECYLKVNGTTSIGKDEYDEINSIGIKGQAQAALSYRYNVRELPYKTFLKDMMGSISVSLKADGTITPDSGNIDTDVMVSLHQEIAVCNSRGLGGVILLEGTVSTTGTVDPQLIELAYDDEEEFISELDKIIKINLKFRVYDDEGRVYYLSTFKNLKSLMLLADKM